MTNQFASCSTIEDLNSSLVSTISSLNNSFYVLEEISKATFDVDGLKTRSFGFLTQNFPCKVDKVYLQCVAF